MSPTRARRAVILVLLAAVWLAGAWATRHVDSDKPTSSAPPAPVVVGEVRVSEQEAPSPRLRGRVKASRSRTPGTDGSGRLNWAALAECESSGNPRAVSRTGKYRGLYQFDLRTWRSVGGSGDPARASRAEQTLRAQLLYAERGRQPWPYCGRFL